MAATLLGAIKTLWESDAGVLGAGLGTLWFEEPKEGVAFPFVVLGKVRETERLLDAENGKEIQSRFQVNLYQTSTEDAENKGSIVKTAFDNKILTVTGRTLLRTTVTAYAPELDRTRSTDTRRVTHTRTSVYAEWRKGN